jgi:hypothetical protein
MNTRGRALLLVGSARRPRSTSESLGTYLLERLAEHGFETETLLLHRVDKSEEGRLSLLAASDRADLLIIAFPLYVDNLPALVIRAMEQITQHRRQGAGRLGQRLLAIVNCGFPEAKDNETALAICRRFAREAGFNWVGGLALGGGPAIDGQPLSKVQGMARNVIHSLDLTAAALAEGQPLPSEAVEAMATPIVPTWVYMLMGGFGWRQQARKHRVQKRLHAQPYEAGGDG